MPRWVIFDADGREVDRVTAADAGTAQVYAQLHTGIPAAELRAVTGIPADELRAIETLREPKAPTRRQAVSTEGPGRLSRFARPLLIAGYLPAAFASATAVVGAMWLAAPPYFLGLAIRKFGDRSRDGR